MVPDSKRPRCTAKQVAKVLLCLIRSDQKLNLSLTSTSGVIDDVKVPFVCFDAQGYKFMAPTEVDALQDFTIMITPAGSEWFIGQDKGSVFAELFTLYPEGWAMLWPMVKDKWELTKAEAKEDLGSLHDPGIPVSGLPGYRVPGGETHEDAPLPEKSIPQIGIIKRYSVTLDGDPVEAMMHDRGVNTQGVRFPGAFIPQNIFSTQEQATDAANDFMDYWKDVAPPVMKKPTDKKTKSKKKK